VHATVTLLPIGAGDERTDWKIGAMRIPVALDDVKLTAAVSSDKPAYEPREPVTVTIDVKDKGQPVAGAEIALAVVDEGILRMTNFHAADPSTALRPGQPLRFDVSDSRDNLAALLDHARPPATAPATAPRPPRTPARTSSRPPTGSPTCAPTATAAPPPTSPCPTTSRAFA
jgi:uncharacterized protein YfaS (alpha-2-macroglobulin family)